MLEVLFDRTHYQPLVEYRKKQVFRTQTFGVVNPDYEQVWGADYNYSTKVSRPSRNGTPYNVPSGRALPATARFLDDTPVKFTCDLQEWVHSICCERVPSAGDTDKKNWFRSLWRGNAFMSNFAGTDTRRDCISKTNLNADFPQVQPMATGGALLRIVGESKARGVDCYTFEAINPLDNYRDYHPTTHKWLFFGPTLSARTPLYDGKGFVVGYEEWYQEPFHHYGEQTVIPIFGFIKDERSSTGWVSILDKGRVRVLQNDEPVPNPYLLRDGRQLSNPYEGL